MNKKLTQIHMKTRGPWKVKSTKIKYKNPWIKVREDKVITPGGTDGIYGVVKALNGVCVVSIDEQDNIHIVKEFKYAVNSYCLEGVCGGIEEGLTPEQTAHKELREELGIQAKSLEYLGGFDTFTSIVECTMHLYIARGLSFSEHAHEDTEVIEHYSLPLKEAYAMTESGEINHLPTSLIIQKLYIESLEK